MNARPEEESGWVCVGVIGGPRGVRGGFFVKPFLEDRALFQRLGPFHLGAGGDALQLTVLRENTKGFIVAAAGIDSPEAARRLTGRKLYVPRTALPRIEEEDSFYQVDLVGLEARAPDGRRLGRVLAVQNFGAGDLIELALERPLHGFGELVLLPFERALFPEVRVAEGWLSVDLDAWVARHEGTGETPQPGSRRRRSVKAGGRSRGRRSR